MGRQTQDEMLLCSNELYVVGHCPHPNLANNGQGADLLETRGRDDLSNRAIEVS